MATCFQLANQTILNSTTTWANLDRSTLRNTDIASYLRPDTGGALLPWIYTVIFLALHLPIVVVRVVRYERVQWWLILSALLTSVVYLQAFISTGLEPTQVLVWTPVLLIIDAGAMLQVCFLVIEEKTHPTAGHEQIGGGGHAMEEVSRRGVQNSAAEPFMPPRQISDDSHHHVEPKTKPTAKTIILDPVIPAAICSFLLFIFILILQIRGLVAAVSGNKPESAPPTAWCSPAFQPFGVIVLDGNCRTYEISQSRQRGIGCIVLPGIWQQQWLRMSVAFTALSLLLQGLDLLWMAMVNRSWKPKGVKVKRPWLTMIFGVVVLGVTLFYGIDYAQSLPSGITDLVTVVEDVDGYKGYSATLKAAGLRGAVIGWSDGLFSSWKQLYYGA